MTAIAAERYTGASIKAAVERWLQAAPAERVVVVDPRPETIEILSQEVQDALGVPVLLGASRKKLIDHICDVPNPKDRVPGSLAAALAGAAQGAQIIRVHDVAATRQALAVWEAVLRGTDKVLG